METFLKQLPEIVATVIEVVAVLLIAYGAGEGIIKLVMTRFRKPSQQGVRREVWLGFAQWILLGLEFTLAADIVKTAISPTWNSIGLLAAIAVIRTFLSYFLERDLAAAERQHDAVT